MEYRKLGKTEIDVSVICLGTMTWGQQNTEAEAHEQLSYATDHEVNFIDVAELYPVPARAATQGRTEAYIGTWLHKRQRRDDLILATKICGPGPYTEHIRTDQDYSEASIRSALEGSLKRLQTDYVDVYQIHWPARATNFFGKRGYHHRVGWDDNIDMIVSTLSKLRKEGKIRYFGISNETPWGLMSYLRAAERQGEDGFVSVQNPYNLLNRLYEVGLAEMSIREGIGLLAYSPMAFGLLSGKYHEGKDDPKDRINQFHQMSRYNSEASKQATAEYLKVAQQHGLSLAQMSLAFVNQQPFVTSNIIGATSLKQLKENMASIDITLSKETIRAINAIQDQIPNPAP